MEKLLRHFTAHSPQGGIYEIFEYQNFLVSRTRAGTEETPGLKRYALDSGEAINRIEKGVYEMLSPFGDVRLTSRDPEAS